MLLLIELLRHTAEQMTTHPSPPICISRANRSLIHKQHCETQQNTFQLIPKTTGTATASYPHVRTSPCSIVSGSEDKRRRISRGKTHSVLKTLTQLLSARTAKIIHQPHLRYVGLLNVYHNIFTRPAVLNLWSAAPWGSVTPTQVVRDCLGN
jgi:hypothetical protein